MEQDPNMLAAVVGWVLEQALAVALGTIIGTFGAKWWFGKKNQEKLDQLQQSITELQRERNVRPRPEPSAAASPTPAAPSPAPPAPHTHIAPESRTLAPPPPPPPPPPNAMLSPQELLDLVNGHTDMAAKRMLEPHKGRRHVVTGAVREVTELHHGVIVAIDMADGVSVYLTFDRGHHDEQMVSLRRNDKIFANGLLQSASNHISLEKCSLDNVLPTSSGS